jgi:hypothetical protein
LNKIGSENFSKTTKTKVQGDKKLIAQRKLFKEGIQHDKDEKIDRIQESRDNKIVL